MTYQFRMYRLRRALDFSVSKLAKHMQVSNSTVILIESGKVKVLSTKTLCALRRMEAAYAFELDQWDTKHRLSTIGQNPDSENQVRETVAGVGAASAVLPGSPESGKA